MSASLVGSEMCIRDRPPVGTPHFDSSVGIRRCRWKPGGGGKGAQQSAVSYTHLTLPTICSV
eukprot:12321263-Alexandrium_andersonii.AAC.1